MKGLEVLKAMRLKGRAPASVIVLVGGGHELGASEHGHFLSMNSDEKLDRVDLRPLFGMKVFVHGPFGTDHAVKDACLAITKAKPLSVLGFATDRPSLPPECLVFAEGNFSWLG